MRLERLYFRKSQRIVSRADFERVLSHKCFACKGMLRLYKAPNALELPRFGVSVSMTCGPAVTRNRLKRLGREVFRAHQHEIPAGFDYILIFTRKKPKIKPSGVKSVTKTDVRLSYQEVQASVLSMLRVINQR